MCYTQFIRSFSKGVLQYLRTSEHIRKTPFIEVQTFIIAQSFGKGNNKNQKYFIDLQMETVEVYVPAKAVLSPDAVRSASKFDVFCIQRWSFAYLSRPSCAPRPQGIFFLELLLTGSLIFPSVVLCEPVGENPSRISRV